MVTLDGSILDTLDIEDIARGICKREVRVFIRRDGQTVQLLGDVSVVEGMAIQRALQRKSETVLVVVAHCPTELWAAAEALVRMGCDIADLPERFKKVP